jgi:hypothetical protein
VLLSSYLYFFGIKKKADEQKAKEESTMLFPGLKKDDVTDIALKTKEAFYKIRRTGKNWEILEPMRAPAEDNLFDNMTSVYSSAKMERKLEGVSVADYGLNLPEAYAELVTKDGKKYALNMAGYNPTNSWAYSSKPGDNSTVYMADRGLREFGEKTKKDIRYKGLIKNEFDGITKIEASLRGKKYTVEKTGSDWAITSPVSKTAKTEKVRAIVDFLRNSGISGYEDLSAAAKHGLASPSEYVKIYEGSAGQTIYFGALDSGKKSVFARCTLQPDILEVPEHIYTSMPTLDEISNKQLVIYKQDQVQKVSLKYGTIAILAERNQPGKQPEWLYKQWDGLDRKKQESFNINNVVGGIYWAEYKTAADAPGFEKENAEYGFTPPAVEIIMQGKDGKTIGTLLVGSKPAANGDLYVKVPERNMIYTAVAGMLTGMNLPGLDASKNQDVNSKSRIPDSESAVQGYKLGK